MFLTCNICKHSIEYPVSEGAPEEDLFKCRKLTPVAKQNQIADFPVVPADWECNKYQREMISGR